jgi:hypothetical protein
MSNARNTLARMASAILNRPALVSVLLIIWPLQESSGVFSLAWIKVEPTEVKEHVCLEPFLVPITVGFLDQALNLVVQSLNGTIG